MVIVLDAATAFNYLRYSSPPEDDGDELTRSRRASLVKPKKRREDVSLATGGEKRFPEAAHRPSGHVTCHSYCCNGRFRCGLNKFQKMWASSPVISSMNKGRPSP